MALSSGSGVPVAQQRLGYGPPHRLSQRSSGCLAQRFGQRVEHGGELTPRRPGRLLQRPLERGTRARQHCLEPPLRRLLGLPDSSPLLSATPIDPSASATRCSSSSDEGAGLRCASRNPPTSASVSRPSLIRNGPGPHRGQQPPSLDGRQYEQASGRRLLQQLQQRVGRFLARLLGDQPVGLSQDEDPAPAFDRGQRRSPQEQPYTCQTVGGHAVGRLIQRLRRAAPSMIWAMAWAASSTCLSVSEALGLGIGTNQCTSGCAEPGHQMTGPALPARLLGPGLRRGPTGPAKAPVVALPTPGGPGTAAGPVAACRPCRPGPADSGPPVPNQWVQRHGSKLRTARKMVV